MKIDDAEYLNWLHYFELAKRQTSSFKNKGTGILIEIAAQHPLADGRYPDEEFRARLDKGLRLFREFSESHERVFFYIPGSIHMDDCISLSEAGEKYLIENGVPSEFIFGENTNNEFKGNEGVYNSTDECYVAVQLFKTRNFSDLYSVCSPSQLMRKAFSYIRFGIIPFFEVANVSELHHNYIDEYFKMLPLLILDKDALQKDSKLGEKIRKYRKSNRGSN